MFSGMVGFIVAASTLNFTARYISLFLMLASVYDSYNVALSWISSTLLRPIEKHAAAIALVNTVGNFAQIYSPYLYASTAGPRYLNAMIANACFCVCCAGITILLRSCLVNANKALAAIEAENANDLRAEKAVVEEIIDVSSPGEIVALAPDFRYAL
jgi:hypothetical protein